MTDRRAFLSAFAAALVPLRFGPGVFSGRQPKHGSPQYRVRRSDLGMTALFVEEMRPGDICEILDGRVYWRGRVMGIAPPELAHERTCRVGSAEIDDRGKTRLLVSAAV